MIASMRRLPVLSDFIAGWRLTLRVLLLLLRRLLAALAKLFGKVGRGKRGEADRDYRDIRCLTPPPHIRARPDPFIYSQQWLWSRGLGVTWDNPDFRIVDPVTGTAIDRFSLQPDTDYQVEATIHNGSFMAAISASVKFTVHGFGAGTAMISDLGTDTVSVPAMGTAVARVAWHTPGTGGHNCLIATIGHPDDANPLNNVGQHNTDVAVPASPTRRIAFAVGNPLPRPRAVGLRMDSYRLPEDPRCPEDHRERRSRRYLRRLQGANDPKRFPVPEFLNARLEAERLEVDAEDEVELSLELDAPPAEAGPQVVNVHAFADDRLIGGVTAYVFPEGT
jgi:hypothetical protein